MRLGWAKDEPGSNACLCRFKLENVSKLIPTFDLSSCSNLWFAHFLMGKARTG